MEEAFTFLVNYLLQGRLRAVTSGSAPQQEIGSEYSRTQKVHASMLGLPSKGECLQ